MFNTTSWPKYPTGLGAEKANSGHHGNRWLTLPATYDWLADPSGPVGQWNHPTAYAGVSRSGGPVVVVDPADER
jgi:hypothetical protein